MISIVMATHNGADTLPMTLDAFCRLEKPPGGMEIIIIDNNSSDDTRQILERYLDRLPLTLLFEPERGKARALHRGFGKATGDLILITDDDVIPDPRWLAVYEEAAARYPDVSLFAGQVRHHWQRPPPAWLERMAEQGLVCGGTDIDRSAGAIPPGQVKGANFALRRTVLDEIRFREDIGWGSGGDMVPGEESDFMQRAVDAGHFVRFLPEACLQHIVRPHEATLYAVLQRYFRVGRARELLTPTEQGDGSPVLFGVPRHLLRSIPVDLWQAFEFLLRLDPYRSVRRLIDVAITWGRIHQWRRRRRTQ